LFIGSLNKKKLRIKMNCTLTILDPTLAHYLGQDKFESYKDFQKAITNRVNDGLVPLKGEIVPVIHGDKLLIEGQEFNNANDVVKLVITGMLDSNDPIDHFRSFLNTFDSLVKKHQEPLVDTSEKLEDKSFIESMVPFFENYPIDTTEPVYQEFLSKKESFFNLYKTLEEELESEEEVETNESEWMDSQESTFFEYTKAAFYKPSKKPVLDLTHPLSLLKHNVSNEVERQISEGEVFGVSFAKDNAFNAQTVENIEDTDFYKKGGYGVVAYLYKKVGNDWQRVYVKSYENKYNGKVELTTDKTQATEIGQNKVTGFVYTLPDFSKEIYGKVSPSVRQSLISFRNEVKSTGVESPIFQIRDTIKEYPKAPSGKYFERVITAKEFLQGNTKSKLILASKEDFLLRPGNLFLQMEHGKVPLDRSPLSEKWQDRVFSLVNASYTESDAVRVAEFLNKLLDFKGGDLKFIAKGNKIVPLLKFDFNKKTRFEHPKEINTDDLIEALKKARINVFKDWVGQEVLFPIIFNGGLQFSKVNFNDFYLDHHQTTYRQVNVEGSNEFGPIKSLLFDVETQADQIIKEREQIQENPVFGSLPIEKDSIHSTLDVIKEFPTLINKVKGINNDVLVILNSLLENKQVQERLKDSTVTFTTQYGQDFKGISGGKEILVNFYLHTNPEFFVELVAHEVIHTLTADWVTSNSTDPLVERLEELVRQVPESVVNLIGDQGYGKDDPRFKLEVLARLSDPKVAKELKKIKTGKKNFLDTLKDIVKEILGKIFGINSQSTLYSDFLENLIEISTKVKEKKEHTSIYDQFSISDLGDLTFGYSQEDVDTIQNKFSPVYLEQAINRLNGEIFHFIHSKGGSNQFLNGEVSFDKVFLHYYQSVVDYLKANEGKVGKEEHDFLFEFLLKNRDFVKDYWIENTNLASLRKPKKGEYISDKVVEDYEPLSDPNEVTDSENEEKEKDLRDITGGEDINEKTFDFDRSGVEQSSLEAADPISRAFVKMIPKIERGEEGTKIYSDEDRKKAIDNGAKSDHFVSVPGGFIKYETDETNSIVLNDYTQNWNLMGIHFQGKMSLEEMLKSIDDTPSLIDVVPEIYVFKDRLSLDIKNDSQFTLNASLERAFKKAFVNTYVLIRNEDGRLYLVNESKDLTTIGKRKIDSGFLQTIDEKYPQFYERETDEVRIKALVEFLRSRKENENKSLSELLGFGFHPKTIKNNGVFTSEITNFDEHLENMFTNTELVNVPISISEIIFKGTYVGNKKIDGAAGLAKSVLKLEDKNRPLSATTVIKNAEGENQSTLSVLNSILQYREILNNAQTIEELNEKMERTKNPLFNYSLTKKALFTTLLNESTNELVEERTNVKVDIGLFNGFKQEQKGRATKGKLTIDLEGADWLMLNFVGMIKGGIIENTRAETASTSYYFKLTNWSNEVGTSDTPLKISDVFSQYNKREGKINISKESKIFNIWSDYFKGNLERMNLQQSDKWGLFDFLSREGKEILRDGLNEDVLLDELNSFFNKESDEFRRMFDQEIGGYEAIVGDAMVLDKPTYGDRELWNKIKGFEEEYKAFYVLNSMIIHTEETILFQGDLSQTPKYYKRAKGVQSTGTPVSQSPSLVQWVNKSLENNSIAVALGFTPTQIGKNYLSSTMKDDEKPSAYKDRFLDGFVKSQKLYYSSIGVNISEDQLRETAQNLLVPKTKKGEGNYGMVNIGDGAAYTHPDFHYATLKLIGNISTEQQKVYEALVLDTIKNSKEYFGIESRQITESEEKKIKEGFALLAEGKGQFPLIKFTYRNTMSNSDSVVKEEVMDKFALFPLFPQFVHDKPVAKEMLKSMMKEGLGYVKFQSGTKIDTTPPIDFIGMVEKGEVDVSFENFTHELSTEFLREQIKTPNKHKTKNTFGSQVRKNILAELGQVKLSREENKGDFKRKWEKLNQEFSLALKREILGRFKIKETAPDQWDFTKVDKAQVAQILLEESTRRELPYNLKVFFDKYRRGIFKEAQLISAYDLFESSMGAPQIQNLLASIIKKISIQKLKGAQYRQVASSPFDRKIKSEGKTRELGFYEFNEEGTKAAECKIGMGGDFLNLLNLKDITNYIEYRQQEDTIFNRLSALNKKLEDDAWVEAHKDVLTIASYRIPNQGHNSDEVFVIREFLPPMHAGEIILPPEVTTQSGTDYDYDKMSAIVPSINKDGTLVTKGSKGIQNEMIKTFSDILLDPVNYWKLIVPNSNQIIFDLLKEKLLPKLYPNLKLDSFSPSEIITLGRNYRQFKSVQGKNLLGIAAVWNPFTTILQNHNIRVNSIYKKKVGFGTEAFFIEVPINPLFGSTDVSLYTKDNLNKLEVISQLINVTVDMPSDDTFGMSVFTQDDFSAFIYGMSLLNYGFENSMMFFHQPIIYKFKDLISKTVRKGYKKSRANLMVAHKLLDIELIKTQDGNINVRKSEANLFKKLTEIEKSLNSELLAGQLKSVEEAVQVERFSDQQKAVLAHYLKLLDQANQVRTVQSALNFDTSPDNNLAKTRDRQKDFIEAQLSEIIPYEKIIEVKEDSVISGLYVSVIYESLVSEIFPVLYSSKTKEAFDQLRDKFVEHSEVAFRKATNDFLLAIVQNYGTYKNQNITDFTLPYIRGDKKADLIREATKIKKQLKEQGKRLRLLDILVANTSRKGTPTLSNPQLIMGMENSSGDKDQITEEFRELLNNPKTKDFAETLAIVGLVQSGWSKSPLYFSDVIPEEFITPIINKALKEYQELSKIDKRGFIIAFKSNFEDYQAKSLGGRGNYEDAYRIMDYTVNVQPTIEATRKAYEEKKKEDEFTEYEVIETETKQLGGGNTIDISQFVNHSGGALGADSAWDEIGKEFGMLTNRHYYFKDKTPKGNIEITQDQFDEGIKKANSAAKATYGFQYSFSDNKVGRLLSRNWQQVKNSDAVFAIGKIVQKGDKLFDDDRIALKPAVSGGTGYAVEMAIQENKPVYVFDQNKNQWFTWDGSDFIQIETPTLTKNFAGIGTRQINEQGKQAIKDVYQKTIEQGVQPDPTLGYNQESLEAKEIQISYGSEDNYLEALKKVSEQRGKIKWEDVFRNYSRFPQRVKNALTRSSTLRENDKLFSGGSFETSGRRIESIQDLADLYLVHRSPTIEKLHYIFLKNNEIVATHAATAGLVNRTAKFNKGLFEKTYEESGADSVYLLHNHPSGNHLPSDADLLMTHQITKSSNVNFKGQLIINTDKFSFIPATKDIFKYLEYEEVDYKKKPDVLFKTRITLGTSTKQITNSLKQIGDILLKEPGINSVIYLDVYATIVGYDSFTDGDVSKIDFQDQMKKKGAYSYVIFSPSKESNDAVESSSNHVKGYSSFYLENGQIKASLRFDKEFTNQVDLEPNQIQFWEKVFFQPEDVLDTITQPKICTKM